MAKQQKLFALGSNIYEVGTDDGTAKKTNTHTHTNTTSTNNINIETLMAKQ